MEPTAGRAGREVPIDDACSGCQVHLGGPLRMEQEPRETPGLCSHVLLRTGLDTVATCVIFLGGLVSSFSLLTAYKSWNTRYLAQENKRASTMNILHGGGAWCNCPGPSENHGDKGGARCCCWDAKLKQRRQDILRA